MAYVSTDWKSNRGFTFPTKELAQLDDIACDLSDAIDGIDPDKFKSNRYERGGYGGGDDYSSIRIAYVIARENPSLAVDMTKLIKSRMN